MLAIGLKGPDAVEFMGDPVYQSAPRAADVASDKSVALVTICLNILNPYAITIGKAREHAERAQAYVRLLFSDTD
jgi:hypothetical protein